MDTKSLLQQQGLKYHSYLLEEQIEVIRIYIHVYACVTSNVSVQTTLYLHGNYLFFHATMTRFV